MSALEIIEQIKQMPSSERGEVIQFVRDLPCTNEFATDAPVVRDYRTIALKIMSEHDELFRKLA